jgi:DNA-binding PadR family transcriptional regulator
MSEVVIVLDREFFLGFIKIHILYHASKEPIFGVEITEELARHGYHLSPGTLYPTLHRLEKEGYLKQSLKVVDGKVRKYYTITEQGNAVLKEASRKIKELVEEVLEDKDGMAETTKKSESESKK